MKIDKLIKELEQVKEQHGNLEVKLRTNAQSKQQQVLAVSGQQYKDFDSKACYIKHMLDREWFEQQN